MDDDQHELEAALESQQALLESCLPLVFAEYDEAIQRNVPTPVVVLVDCEDEIGGEIARAWVGDEAVEAAIAEQEFARESPEETTTFARVVSFAEARREIPEVFPYLAPALATPPQEGFLAISVTAGGASVLTVPPSARD
ncbi:MAG: hypothetical protein KF688_01770 [Pirellulales bacterium]|nr:hypothetical protein [Pirellulales bacterium]